MRITALVCTRDRGDSIRATVRSILENDHPDFEVIVIDQSIDDRSLSALTDLQSDPRLRYVASPTVGLSRARNIGIAKSHSSLVAMTDDDCTVPQSWLTQLEAAFETSERVAIVLGGVVPAPYDRSNGFIVGYLPAGFIAGSIRDKHRVEGMAACMAISTEAWTALSGFDEMLGAGSPLHSADETDIVIRALFAGHEVHESPEIVVVHHRLHDWGDADRVTYCYLLGIGATLAKHLKCGRWGIAYVAGALAHRWVFAEPVVKYGFKPSRRVRLSGFLRGFSAGLKLPVDRRTGKFAAGAYALGRPLTRSRTNGTSSEDFKGIHT